MLRRLVRLFDCLGLTSTGWARWLARLLIRSSREERVSRSVVASSPASSLDSWTSSWRKVSLSRAFSADAWTGTTPRGGTQWATPWRAKRAAKVAPAGRRWDAEYGSRTIDRYALMKPSCRWRFRSSHQLLMDGTTAETPLKLVRGWESPTSQGPPRHAAWSTSSC
eukprot:3632612-Pyramimonas_sp.AAC.1